MKMLQTDAGGSRLRSRSPWRQAPPARRRSTTRVHPTPRSGSATPIPTPGNASAYGQIGKTIEAYFKMVNDNGGINGRKVNFITYDDGYAPPKTVEMVRKLVEEDKVLFVFQTLGTPPNTAIHKYMNGKKVPQLFVATGASKWGKPKEFPWTMGWQPDYQTEGAIYAKHILANVKDAKIGVLMQNDDYGKRLLQRLQGGSRQGRRQDRAGRDLRGDRPDGRQPDDPAQELRRQRVLQHHHAEVRGAGDQEGGRDRLEAGPLPQQRVVLGRRGDEAGRLRRRPGHPDGLLHQGPDGPAVGQGCRHGRLERVHGQVLSGRRQEEHVPRLCLCRDVDGRRGAQARRRQPHAREHHEAGGQPQGRRDSLAAARHQDQHQRDGLLSDPVGADWPASRARRSSCSATSCPASPNSRSRAAARPNGRAARPLQTAHRAYLARWAFLFQTHACRHSQHQRRCSRRPCQRRAHACRRRLRRSACCAPPPASPRWACARATASPCCCATISPSWKPRWPPCGSAPTPCPINWHFKADEVAYVLADCGAKVLVAHADLLAAVAGAVPAGVKVLAVETPPEIAAAYGMRAGGVPHGRAPEWDAWLAASSPGRVRPLPQACEHDLHVRHHRPAQGRAPPAAHRRPRSAHGRLPRARVRPEARRAHHDPGPALPLGAECVRAARRPRRRA